MKTIKIDTKSWHWHLLTKYGNSTDYYYPENICDYRMELFRVIFAMFLGSILFTTIIALTVQDAILQLAFSIYSRTWLDWCMAGFVTWAVLFVIAMVKGIEYIQNRLADAARVEQPPSFIKEAYKSWKEKYCAKISLDSSELEN